jgi:hypothetical protein
LFVHLHDVIFNEDVMEIQGPGGRRAHHLAPDVIDRRVTGHTNFISFDDQGTVHPRWVHLRDRARSPILQSRQIKLALSQKPSLNSGRICPPIQPLQSPTESPLFSRVFLGWKKASTRATTSYKARPPRTIQSVFKKPGAKNPQQEA